MLISLIAAASRNDVIGREGDLPWHLPKDLQFFKKTTLNHHIIVGHTTFKTFPKGLPLPNRTNIVMTRQKGLKIEGAHVVNSLEAGLKIAEDAGEEEVFIIGGEEIYRLAMPIADRIYLTRVHTVIRDGDTFFPYFFREGGWELYGQSHRYKDDKHAHDFTIEWWKRDRSKQKKK